MIINILISFFPIMVSAAPVHPTELPSLWSHGEATQDPRQRPQAQTPAPLSPQVEQPEFSQQPDPQGGSQLRPPTQHFAWSPLGGSPMFIPVQINPYLPQSVSMLQQWPMIFPSQSYFPLLSSPYRNQLFSPYGNPRIVAPSLPQNPANQPPNRLAVPAETPSGATPPANTLQPVQQQQNSQIVYLLQQPLDVAVGSVSSDDEEELEMLATIGRLAVFLPSVLMNPSAAAVQPVNQGAGLVDSARRSALPTVATPSGAVQQTQRPQPNNNRVPADVVGATQDLATVPTPVGQTQPTLA